MDERLKKLSSTIVNYSLEVKPNERVLINFQTEKPKIFVKYLIEDIVKVGGIPFIRMVDPMLNTVLSELTKENRIQEIKKHSEDDNENYDSFIHIRYSTNDFENKNVNPEIKKLIAKETAKSDYVRINERKWVLLNYPTNVDSYKAKMSYNEFYDFAFNAMCYDYKKMSDDIKPLKDLMEKTDEVRITGPETDLIFSIKNLPAIPCVGTMNIPDGELYTAPVKTSVNGYIKYNTPSPYQGYVFEGVKLTFKDGKIISATCDNIEKSYKKKLEEIFNTDEGARYVGEFSLGFNKEITEPMGDILYDEKIMGSLHFTPGCCYKDCDNGNKSSVHWDLVLIQREDYGGGCIYFDHRLIRKDGKFVLDELRNLN